MQKRNVCLAILSGIILALAMPKPGIWQLAWVGLAPLLVAMVGARPRFAAVYGFIMAAVYFGIILFWMTIFGYLPWVAVVLTIALYFAVFAAVSSRLMQDKIGCWSYICVPAAWTAIQWARSLGSIGFTWGSLAHLQANVPSITQMASATGPWGIDFLICLFNLALANALVSGPAKRRFGPIAIVSLLSGIIIASGYDLIRVSPEIKCTKNVAVIQGNLPQGGDIDSEFIKLALNRYGRMTVKAANQGADLVVWPETTLPLRISGQYEEWLSQLALGCNTTCIVGAYDKSSDPAETREYNTAYFYDKLGRKLGAYHKVHLVLYGEYVPFRDAMPWLRRYGVRPDDVLAGESYDLVPTDIGRVGVSICFESLFPQISRLETRNGAALLVVLTNDSWFLNTEAARGHLMMSKLRAVENHRYLVRAAGTGISAIIDPFGRSIGELGIFKEGMVTGKIAPIYVQTLYTRIGDIFAYACALVAILSLMLSLRRPARN